MSQIYLRKILRGKGREVVFDATFREPFHDGIQIIDKRCEVVASICP